MHTNVQCRSPTAGLHPNSVNVSVKWRALHPLSWVVLISDANDWTSLFSVCRKSLCSYPFSRPANGAKWKKIDDFGNICALQMRIPWIQKQDSSAKHKITSPQQSLRKSLLQIIQERFSSFKLQVLKNRSLHCNGEVVGLESSERNPHKVHLPAMELTWNTQVCRREFFGFKMVTCVISDLPFFRNRKISGRLNGLRNIWLLT